MGILKIYFKIIMHLIWKEKNKNKNKIAFEYSMKIKKS